MVPNIEEQIYQFLTEQEEERCRLLEIEYKKSETTKGKTVKRKKILKPWKRLGKKALCQDINLLKMVDEYDYELSKKEFQEYCLKRGVLHVAGKNRSRRWDYFADYTKPKSEYLNDNYFQFAQEMNGVKYKYSIEEMKIGWEIIIFGRATLQDCWELFCVELSDLKD